MKRVLVLAGLAAANLACADLVAWFPLQGSTTDVVHGTKGTLVGDADFADARAAEFGGHNGAVLFQDSPQFTFPGSFSVSAQVYPTAWPSGGTSPAGQIAFRGDDRCACDNFSLSLGNDGYFTFYFDSPDGGRLEVRAEAAMGQWQTVLGTFDAQSHQIRLYVDGYMKSQSNGPFAPVVLMEPQSSPGFSIGNVQNPMGGVHNQPFHGLIRDVRLWNSPVMWDAVEAMPRIRQRG